MSRGLGDVYKRQINVIHHINKSKDKNHMIISIDAGKAFDKVQHPLIIKTLSKVGEEGITRTTIKDTWTKPRGRVEVGEGGGFTWAGVEGWGQKAYNCN